MKSLLNELRRFVDLSADFETRLLDLIERRHLLIHRWGIEHDLPADAGGLAKIAAFALALENDAVALAMVLHGYVVQWLTKFPEMLAGADAFKLLKVPDEFKSLTVERSGGTSRRLTFR